MNGVPSDLIRIEEAARIVGKSPVTLRLWASTALPAKFRRAGLQYPRRYEIPDEASMLYSRSEVEAFAERIRRAEVVEYS